MSYSRWFSDHLKGVKWERTGRGKALCPFHQDRDPSMSLCPERGLWFCHACKEGGHARQLAKRLRVPPPDLPSPFIEAYYIYHDPSGSPLYRICRGPSKRFWVERYTGGDKWALGLGKVKPVLYRLPEVLSSKGRVFLVEGEKDVETLRSRGLTATTNPFGAGKWDPSFSKSLRGLPVVLLPDNDPPGLDHMEDVARSLHGLSKSLKLIPLPGLVPKGDVTDWFEMGRTREELLGLVESCPEWEPEKPTVPLDRPGPSPSIEIAAPIPSPPRIEDLPPFPSGAWVGLLDDYRYLVGPSTEAPDSFHYAILVASLGACLGRSFFLRIPHPLYMNFYFLLVGQTGETRKSTALQYGQSIWRSLNENIRLSATPASAEGVYQILSEEEGTRLILDIDELRILLANAQRPGTLNLLAQLNTLYEPREETTIPSRKPIHVKAPFLTIIAATTPEWLDRGLEREVLFGGFLNRFIVLSGEPKPPNPDPRPPKDEPWSEFIQRIQYWKDSLPSSPIEITRSLEAKERYKDWYIPWKEGRTQVQETILPLTARMDSHVYKLAAFYSLLRGRTELSSDDIERAILVVEHSRECTTRIFGHLTLPRQSRLEQRVLEILAHGPRTRRVLKQRVGSIYSREEFNRAIKALTDSGEIREYEVTFTSGQTGKMVEVTRGDPL